MDTIIRTLLGAALSAAMALPVQADELKVVTSFTVIADMARNVAGNAAEVVSITKAGADVHGYQPTPGDLVSASNADLVLYNGLNLEVWFDQFLDNLGDMPSATISAGIDPIAITEGEYRDAPNPHAWMGLDNALIYIDNIEKALSEADPGNAAVYAANADAYKEEVRTTIEPLRAAIGEIPAEDRWLATCEGAFSYLIRDFGMRELYLWPMNAEQVGTPQQVRAVIDTVREHDIPAVFCESTVSQRPAQQVARETNAAYGGMLYVDSLTDSEGAVPTYLDLLRETTETIVAGLTGKEVSQ